ncbi:MAG: acyl-CoA dehydrogenase family protein [Dehalococcoidia bacterium]|nr:acyl-CoA dehydrogenase family protein [Dehalococcoidia bacterium]
MTTSSAALPAIELDPVAKARELTEYVRSLAPEIEASRRIPAELVDALARAGLFHLLVPKSLGGGEVHPVTAAQVVEELAFADGSTGWCVMLAHQTSGFAGLIPEEHAREIWGNGGIVAGTARPIGRAVVTDVPARGYMVSGRWPFASGSSHATWFGGECVVYDGDAPRKDATGNDVTRMCLVPREAVTIHDTWHTMGLRGTASHDFSMEPTFVPEGKAFPMIGGVPAHPWRLYRAMPLLFINHGSHSLGIGRAAVAEAKELMRTKIGWGTDKPLREQARMQLVLAEAVALVESARCFLYDSANTLWDAPEEEIEVRTLDRSHVRLANNHAATASLRAVDQLHSALGTTSIFTKSPLDRQFRDIHTAAAHVMVGPVSNEAAGRVELGLEPGFPFF